jgi:hypothetical protein
MTMRGSCLCGAVHYEFSGSLNFMGHRHCSMCRKSHGAAFATWGIINPNQFVGSKASWHAIADTLPQWEQWPPGMGA